jgi:hypothetical protein
MESAPAVEEPHGAKNRGVAPYLARFSRDVGDHGPRLAVPEEPKNVARYGAPHDSWLGQKLDRN